MAYEVRQFSASLDCREVRPENGETLEIECDEHGVPVAATKIPGGEPAPLDVEATLMRKFPLELVYVELRGGKARDDLARAKAEIGASVARALGYDAVVETRRVAGEVAAGVTLRITKRGGAG